MSAIAAKVATRPTALVAVMLTLDGAEGLPGAELLAGLLVGLLVGLLGAPGGVGHVNPESSGMLSLGS